MSELADDSIAIAITGGAAHTKGSWVDIDASVIQDSMMLGLLITADVFSAGLDTSVLLDIGIGSTGNAVDATVLANITVGYTAGVASVIYIPLFFRKGERIAARIQGTQASEVLTVRPWLEYAPPPPNWAGFSTGELISAVDTATSNASIGDFTDNAFEEVISSTSKSYKAFSYYAHGVGTGMTTTTFNVELGIGAAASEQVIGSWRIETSQNELIRNQHGPIYICRAIPSGSRLAVRKNGTADCSGVFVGWN